MQQNAQDIAVHDIEDLIALFSNLFATAERTRLVCGTQEPFYKPWGLGGELAEVVFAHGFFASALHEVAHWCIAGATRRAQADYGYWYKPDGRSPAEQRNFEQVEVRPQALEWLFSRAAGSAFTFSADNIAAGGAATSPAWTLFQDRVAAQARRYAVAPPARAARFATALAERYGTGDAWRDVFGYRGPSDAT